MSHLNGSLKEIIVLAKDCKDFETQLTLMNSYDVNIRKSLAQNPFLDSVIADRLAFDPSLNVSFAASKNKNCTRKREFEKQLLQNKCVICQIDEMNLDCNNCRF